MELLHEILHERRMFRESTVSCKVDTLTAPGHRATLRDQPKKIDEVEHTHDWEVWVKGTDGANIEHYIDKVGLDSSFPANQRF